MRRHEEDNSKYLSFVPLGRSFDDALLAPRGQACSAALPKSSASKPSMVLYYNILKRFVQIPM